MRRSKICPVESGCFELFTFYLLQDDNTCIYEIYIHPYIILYIYARIYIYIPIYPYKKDPHFHKVTFMAYTTIKLYVFIYTYMHTLHYITVQCSTLQLHLHYITLHTYLRTYVSYIHIIHIHLYFFVKGFEWVDRWTTRGSRACSLRPSETRGGQLADLEQHTASGGGGAVHARVVGTWGKLGFIGI